MFLCLILIGVVTIYSQDSLYNYNFNNEQRFDIDTQYNSIPGTNMYAFSKNNDTLFITDIIPKSLLVIRFKLYTSNQFLLDRLNTSSLYVGIDFNTNHTNNKKTDIVLCNFTKSDATCRDYLYYTDSFALMPNTPGFQNKLLPMGVANSSEVLIFQNVHNYTAYFEIILTKEYPVEFNNSTMLKYLLEDAPNAEYSVFAFYGQFLDSRIENVYANYTLTLQDGFGLPNKSSCYYNIKLIYFLILFLIII
jgi:hypothetical protein